MNGSPTKMTVNVHSKGEHDVYEGEAKMSQEQQDYYKSLIGDGLSRVSVSRDQTDKDFGNGGGVSVNVTLTCDQSTAVVAAAVQLAFQIADQYTWYYREQVKAQMLQRGIIK